MRIKLFVDDMRSGPGEGWTVVRTITEAIRLLSNGWVDVISLDHDIIFEQTNRKVGFSEETFASVARYIAVMPKELLPKICYIHTANPRGCSLMEEILVGIIKTVRVGDSLHPEASAPSTYKEDLIQLEEEREKNEK